jgi:hypothetical protein
MRVQGAIAGFVGLQKSDYGDLQSGVASWAARALAATSGSVQVIAGYDWHESFCYGGGWLHR